MKVHSALGAGCLESTYDACLVYQLTLDGLHFEHQVRLPVVYQGVRLCVIVELKAVEKLLPLHTAQMLTYLKLSDKPVGLLINFNVPHLRQGIHRVVSTRPHPATNQNATSVSSASSVVESLGTKAESVDDVLKSLEGNGDASGH